MLPSIQTSLTRICSKTARCLTAPLLAAGKDINESDMVLLPDASTAKMDPFYQQDTMAIFCDILEPDTGEAYNRDPRGTAKAAENYMRSAKVGDDVYFGPEAEFFVFDDVRWDTDQNVTGYSIDSSELPANTGTQYQGGNMGHRPGPKGGLLPRSARGQRPRYAQRNALHYGRARAAPRKTSPRGCPRPVTSLVCSLIRC